MGNIREYLHGFVFTNNDPYPFVLIALTDTMKNTNGLKYNGDIIEIAIEKKHK